MIRARLLAIPVLVVLAAACDNSILVAHDMATGSDGGANGEDGGSDGTTGPGDSASNGDAPGQSSPIEGGLGDATPLEGTGDASYDGGAADAGAETGASADAADGGGGGGDAAVDGGSGDSASEAGTSDAAGSGNASDSGNAGDAIASGDAGDASTGDAGDAATQSDAATDAGSAEGGATHGPSCNGLPATCGPAHNEDCCAARTVPGGTFNRDNNASFPATVDTFVLDRFEVTVGRFRKFYSGYPGDQPAGGSGINSNVSSDPGWDPKWNGSTYTVSTQSGLDSAIRNDGDDNLPMNCIDWYEAYMFCIWDGGRLPTELEWNYAAAGGSDQRPYPWSTSPTDNTIDTSYAVYQGTPNPASVYAEVGSCSPKGDGKWGHADMAGNVMEWTEDWRAGYPATCVDCADVPWNDTIISPAPYRQIRGGSAGDYTTDLLNSSRWYYNAPNFRIDNIGVRCARNP
jgi:formylglycine-generating enzyme required for sulfatase activity